VLVKEENEANLANPSLGLARKLGMTPGRRTQFHGFEHIIFELETSRRVNAV
jgi:hypothetical protein